MTDYTKSTNFATKDSLPSGNPAKIVKGTEINTEFDNIATAIATKSNKASPTFTGTLTAVDATLSGNLTVAGNATISGNLTFGDADTDSITLTADVASSIIPDTDDTYDLGSATKEWRNLYVDGTAYVDAIDLNGTAITATAAELNTLDGITATVTELNYTDGVTSNIQTQIDTKAPTASPTFTGTVTIPTVDINAGAIDGTAIGATSASTGNFSTLSIGGTAVTATAAELNALDGITATVTELNLLDGVTATTAEINYLDGVTSNIQTQLDSLQDLDADLTAIAALSSADGNFIVGSATGWVAESGATARTSLGLTIGTDVQAYDADTAKYDDVTANFTGTLQNGGSNVLVDSDIGSTVQAYDATIVVDADIGSTVQAYDSNLTSFVGTFTLPTTDSTAGYVLKTDGAGTLSFVAQSAYDESSVAITGGTIDGTTIGGTTAAAGTFTAVTVDNIVIDGDVINYGAGDVTQTFSANSLTLAGGKFIYNYTNDIEIKQDGYGIAWTGSTTVPKIIGASGGTIRHLAATGSDAFTIEADGDSYFYGNVGIGITPSAPLHVQVAGDAYGLFTRTGATNWFYGIDDSDSDAFVIGTGSTVPNGTNSIRIAQNSDVTVPNGNLTVSSGQYIEDYATTGTSGAVTIDLDTGNLFSTAMAGAVTYTFSNAATSGLASSFTLKVVNNGSAITWPTSVDWPSGTAPTLSASGATDVFTFFTHDGGTTWYGFTAGQGMA